MADTSDGIVGSVIRQAFRAGWWRRSTFTTVKQRNAAEDAYMPRLIDRLTAHIEALEAKVEQEEDYNRWLGADAELRAENARLREALAPLIAFAEDLESDEGADADYWDRRGLSIPGEAADALAAARALLTDTEEP